LVARATRFEGGIGCRSACSAALAPVRCHGRAIRRRKSSWPVNGTLYALG
jgi:hypothetical protein